MYSLHMYTLSYPQKTIKNNLGAKNAVLLYGYIV